MKENGGVYKPSCILDSSPVFFAIDNSDLKVDYPYGKGQLNPTVTAIYRQYDLITPDISCIKC